MTEFPYITVVVPVKNEEKFIAETLGFITGQDYPKDRLDIIVAAGTSDDRTDEIVAEMSKNDPRIRLIHNPVGLSSGGRNVGINNAKGEIITFIDGHTFIDNDQLLKNTARFMEEKNLKVLSRPQFLDTPNNGFFQKAVALARKSTIGHGLDSTIYTNEDKIVDPSSSGASYKKELFSEIGQYDERFDACEDVELNYRAAKAGYDSFTSAKLAVYYYPRDSVGGLFNQLKRYGAGRFRLFRKHPDSISLGTIIPLLITVGFPLVAIISLIFPKVWYLFGLGFIPYVGMILLWSLFLSLKKGIKYFPVFPIIYFAIHNALGWGFFSEAIRTFFGRGVKFN